MCAASVLACHPEIQPSETPSERNVSEEAVEDEEPAVSAGAEADDRDDPTRAPADVAGAPANAQTTDSGLAHRVIREGFGSEHPGAGDRVIVHYSGWTTDGALFDSSYARGEPVTLLLDQVIPGWTEGVQLMVQGEVRRFWIPVNLAYAGASGAPEGMLVFDIELLSHEAPPPPPTTPESLDAPPESAEVSESGVASRVLEAGTGTEHPSPDHLIELHLDGWQADGELFDSTRVRDRPIRLPLRRMSIPGLREGIQWMVEGERRRFWVPEVLAFAGRPGAPVGALVIDIELLSIQEMPVQTPE